LIGHLENAYPALQPRDTEGKLPYENRRLCAPDDRKKKAQSFAQASVECYGSTEHGKGIGKTKHPSHGMGKAPANNSYHAAGGATKEGPMQSEEPNHQMKPHVGKKPQERLSVHVQRKRKGQNGETSDITLPAI
jgi:hypothetical protein